MFRIIAGFWEATKIHKNPRRFSNANPHANYLGNVNGVFQTGFLKYRNPSPPQPFPNPAPIPPPPHPSPTLPQPPTPLQPLLNPPETKLQKNRFRNPDNVL